MAIRQTRGHGGVAMINPQDVYEESSTKVVDLGTTIKIGMTEFVYCKNAGATLTRAKWIQQADEVDNRDLLSVATTVAGTNKLHVQMKTSCAANCFEDGVLFVQSGTTKGQMYTIKSHPAATSTVSIEFTLYEEIATKVSNGDDFVTLMRNPFISCTVGASAAASRTKAIGVPLINVTSNYYFWAACRGLAPVLFASNTGATKYQGQAIIADAGVAGAVTTQSAATAVQPLATKLGNLLNNSAANEGDVTLAWLACL